MLLRLILMLTVLAAPLSAEFRVPQSQAEISLSFVPLVKEAAPAVVNIYARRVVQNRSPFADDPFFREFFRDFGQMQPRVQNSLGSGVILSEDGILVSNHHVVGDAQDIRIVTQDRREYSASVLLADEEADLAILQIDGATDLPFLRLRENTDVEVGELVLAIGNPFGVGQTVSSGIVSGLARSGAARGGGRGYFIQTDAPINPGNSGGALIDMTGQLIGINTSILTRSGGSNGIGFAIPAALVAAFVDQARAGNTRFERPWMGLTGQPLDQALADSFGLIRPQGVLISDKHPQSPMTGVEIGDLVLSVNTAPVNTPAEMVYHLAIAGIGSTAELTVLRGGKETAVTVDLRPPPGGDAARLVLSDRTAIPGLELSQVTPSLIADLNLSLNLSGVMVTNPGRTGARAGLRAGDILRAINGTRLTSPKDAERLLSETGRNLRLDVERGGRRVVMRFRL